MRPSWFLPVSLFWATSSAAAPIAWTFQKIADTSTAMPEQSGVFSDLSTPALAGGVVAFRGSVGSTLHGIYAVPAERSPWWPT
jgi:hypothetical protein